MSIARTACLSAHPVIILDKSYLFGASTHKVQKLCKNFRVLMLVELLFELLTGDLAARTSCFRKFPKRENPISISADLSQLMRWEVAHKHPASPLWDHRIRWKFTFNEGLSTGDFRPTPDQSQGIESWENNVGEDVDAFLQEVGTVERLFPQLKGVKPDARPEAVKPICARISTDFEMMREAYDAFKPDGFPPSSIVGRRWALLRRFQVHLLACLELFSKHGPDFASANSKRLENERVDLNYLIMAVLAKGLATLDGDMARRFKMLCPDGILIDYSTILNQ